jgi:hypothetical protein
MADPSGVGEGVGSTVAFGGGGERVLITRPILLTGERLVQNVKADVPDRGAQTVEVRQLIDGGAPQCREKALRRGPSPEPLAVQGDWCQGPKGLQRCREASNRVR